jgi:hypothetical protein
MMYVNSIEPGEHAIITMDHNSLIINSIVLVNGGNQLFSSIIGPGGNGKVTHLMANKHSLAINSALVQVPFMGGRPELSSFPSRILTIIFSHSTPASG